MLLFVKIILVKKMCKFHILLFVIELFFFFPKFKFPLKIPFLTRDPAYIWVSLHKYINPAELLPSQESRMFSALPFSSNLTKVKTVSWEGNSLTPTSNDILESIRKSSGCCCWCDQFGKQLSTSRPNTADRQQLFLCRRSQTSSWQTHKHTERECVCVSKR